MNKKVKAILIGLLAIVTATGAAFGIAAQKSNGEKAEKATYRSSVQTQNEQIENEANEANETSEENEASEQGETAEANETSEENEMNEADEANEVNEADETAETNAKEQNETAESANLQSSAKITPEQAKAAALAQISGTVKNVRLENEGGNVVYAVEIQTADGGIREVNVDAGNGQVLPAESGAENDGESD
ncbi:MAG: PepSY domain-containing protein [Pyrinomonadaceae bacterium]